MIQHRAARFVLNQPWNRQHWDSISELLQHLKWPSLQVRRKQARLIFLFKILNGLICIPNQYLPSPFPSGVAKVGNGWAQAQPIMSSAQPIFISIVQSIYAPFHVKIYNK